MRVSEVEFQGTKKVPILLRGLAFTPGVIRVVMATRAQDPRDGSAELMAVPSKGFLSWRG